MNEWKKLVEAERATMRQLAAARADAEALAAALDDALYELDNKTLSSKPKQEARAALAHHNSLKTGEVSDG